MAEGTGLRRKLQPISSRASGRLPVDMERQSFYRLEYKYYRLGFNGNHDQRSPDAKTTCLAEVGTRFEDPVANILTTDKRGYAYWAAPSNPYGEAAPSETLGIPPPMALGGPADPFYDISDPKIQAYLSLLRKASSRRIQSHSKQATNEVDPRDFSRPSSATTTADNLSNGVRPTPTPRNILSSSAPLITALHARDNPPMITAAAVPHANFSNEATIGHFTW
ncbi:hypothetical protein ACLMJK_002018 [Lecanora helva]